MSKYEQIIEWVFARNYRPGDVIVRFSRDELVLASSQIGFERIKNLGDIPYSFRFRRELPHAIQSTAPPMRNGSLLVQASGVTPFVWHSLVK